jgi:predicted dehydrogenase
MSTIGAGIIGGGAGGWAANGHVPALRAVPGYELRAISTTRRESAEEAARKSGIEAAFDDHRELVAHPGVDLVVVSVKVPHHRELISAALDAGKMVYSEWPLGVSLDEAAGLAASARTAGVRTVIGLQARFAPVVRYIRDLVAQGYTGRVLGTTLTGSGLAWGPETSRGWTYMYDAANGATPLSSSALHALEAVNFALGDFEAVSATLVTGLREVTVTGEDTTFPVTVPDQVAVTGTLHGGAAISVFYRGGAMRGDGNLRWEIHGTEGDLLVTAPGVNGNLQVAPLELFGGRGGDTALAPLEVPDRYHADVPRELTGPARNVAHLYASLARDLREGGHEVQGFDHALRRHELIAAIETASRTGERQDVRSR